MTAKAMVDKQAAQLLATLTPTQLDAVGQMLGMSNMGLDRFDLPESIAESEEMYEGMLVEIRDWRRQLRCKRCKWGWCNDLPELAAEAVRRHPS